MICIAESVKVDVKRDTALMKIIGTYNLLQEFDPSPKNYAFSIISDENPILKMRLFCIGQPGRDDLESKKE